MKTIKLSLSIALVALIVTLFGKIAEPNIDCNYCPTDVEFEQDLSMESWMSLPFEATVENDLALEEWMAIPFGNGFMESDLILEDWMSAPFEATDYLQVEQWMTSAWS